jgi:DNA-binding transcriptional LysR family regulator
MSSSIKAAELTELLAFSAVARHRSFRRAAIDRGMTTSAISHAIRRLEERFSVRLLHRTTRSVSLTEPGAALLKQLEPAFIAIGTALDGLNDFRDKPTGKVRLNVPASLAREVVGPILAPLLAQHPQLHLDIVATDRLVDIAKDGFDAGIRLGERLSRDVVATKIGPPLRFAVVSSPVYAARYGLPATPRDLESHHCIRYRFPSGSIFEWEFEKAGESMTVDVDGPITLDDQYLMVQAAIDGAGLAYVWDFQIAEYCRDGRLLRCLEDWCPELDDLYLYYPSRRHISAGLRVLIDTLKARRSIKRQK